MPHARHTRHSDQSAVSERSQRSCCTISPEKVKDVGEDQRDGVGIATEERAVILLLKATPALMVACARGHVYIQDTVRLVSWCTAHYPLQYAVPPVAGGGGGKVVMQVSIAGVKPGTRIIIHAPHHRQTSPCQQPPLHQQCTPPPPA